MTLEIIERIAAGEPTATMTLTYDLRRKSRLLARLDDGEAVSLLLPRGSVLRQGDLLRGRCGRIVEVRAALEQVSCIATEDPLLLARAAYHLGNRHVALELAPGRLRYLHDHVLDAMMIQMGLSVSVEQTRFEPEAGAYGSRQHPHGH